MIMLHALAFPDKFALGADDAAAEQLRNHVDDTGTAEADGLLSRIADNIKSRLHGLLIDLTCLNRAVGRTHTTADIAALEGRSCGTCTAHHEVGVTEYQLTVGSQVDEQGEMGLVPDHADQSAGSNIAAHIAADIRRDDHMGVRMHVQADVRRIDGIGLIKGRNIGLHTQWICVDTQQQMVHGGVASHGQPVNLMGT